MMSRKFNVFIYSIIFASFAYFLGVDLRNVASLSLVTNVASSSYSLVVLILFLFSIFYINQNKKCVYKIDTGVLKHFMFFIYGASIFFSLFVPLGNRISYILIILPYILYLYMYVSCHRVSNKIISISFVIIFIYLIYVYAQEYAVIVVASLTNEATTNASYFVLYLLPLVLCINVKWIKVLAIIAAIIVVVSSSKRGGTIAVVLSSLVYFITEYFLIKEKKLNWGIIFLGGMIVAVVVYGSNYIQDLTVFGRIEAMADDEGSGRMDVYRHTLMMISDANVFNLLFGHGWNRVVSDSVLQLSAHNDFLEVMYDFGIIGIVLYISLYCFLIKKLLYLLKAKSIYAPAMFVSLVLFSINSLVSHIVIYPAYLCLFTTCWGYILGMERKSLIN